MNVIFVTGTAGSGKSLLTSSLTSWYREKSQDAISVNLDPGVIALPYDADVDVRTMVDLQEIMNEYSLGPNGALILANDLLASKLHEIQEEVESAAADFVIVDTPGQVELFAYRESGPFIAKNLSADSKVVLFLVDSLLASSPTNFLSLSLLATSVQLRIGLPQVPVLSKIDLAKADEVSQIMKWTSDPALFEEALLGLRSGEEYSLYAQLFRSMKKLSMSTGLHPVSSYTRDGFISLVGDVSRILAGGEEFEEH